MLSPELVEGSKHEGNEVSPFDKLRVRSEVKRFPARVGRKSLSETAGVPVGT